MNRYKTHYYRLQIGGIRYQNRQPPLWMKLNQWSGKCWCGSPIEKPRRKYCCQTHADLYYFSIHAFWNAFREGVIRLHNYTCAMCGFESPASEYGRNDTYFDVDHIQAISLDGLCYDIENVRLLCKNCHKIKTAADMKQLASNRKSKEIQKLEVFV